MSYDIEFGVKVADTDVIIRIAEPPFADPTYNVGDMIRACTGWNFKQHEWYKLSDVIPNIEKGIHEMRFNRSAYKQYLPDNGWGNYNTVLDALEGMLKTAHELAEWQPDGFDLIQHLYVRW